MSSHSGVSALNNGHMTVDFNHPLAGKALALWGHWKGRDQKNIERGGTSIDWLETLTSGPGMQARWQSQQTDYFSETPLNEMTIDPTHNFTITQICPSPR